MILDLYLGQGWFFIWSAGLFFPKSVFGRGLKLPNRGNLEKKKWCASIVSRVFSLL